MISAPMNDNRKLITKYNFALNETGAEGRLIPLFPLAQPSIRTCAKSCKKKLQSPIFEENTLIWCLSVYKVAEGVGKPQIKK